MKQKIRVKGFVIKEITLNPSCPKCDAIVAYSYDEYIPEFCPSCHYDLKRPINPIHKFFHNLFWALGGKEDVIRYQLAHYEPPNLLPQILEKIKTIENNCKCCSKK